MMMMPKAAVNENHFFAFAENKVGFSGEVFGVKSVAVSHREGKPSHNHLRLRVFPPHQAHSLASLFFREGV